MQFFGLRYFAIKSSMELFDEEIDSPQELFIQAITKGTEISYYKKKYTVRTLEEKGDYIIGYLLKSVETNLIVLNDDFFDEDELRNWEKLLFIVDKKRQLFICQQKQSIATPENVQHVLDKICGVHTKKYQYEIRLEFLVDDNKFWDIIDKSEGLYQIGFSLNAPNLFGGSKKANSWLKTLKEKHNMTSVQVGLNNEDGELAYNEEELESYRDYADSGGGNWTLGAIQNGRKRRYNSKNHLRTNKIELETDNPNYVKKNLNRIKGMLITLISKIDDLYE